MDSNAPENSDSKAEFRKPSNDAANRKYRRRSPEDGSSSPDGSARGRNSSPVPSREESADEKRRKDESRDLDGDHRRSGRSGESYRHSDRQSSRSSYRYDDNSTRDGRSDDYGRNYVKSTNRSGRDSRGNSNLDYSRGDKEHRSRDYSDDVDKYSRGRSDASGYRSRNEDTFDRRRQDDIEDRARDKDRVRNREDRGDLDEKTDRRNFGDRKSKHSSAHDESRGQRDELFPRRESSGNRVKEASPPDYKGLDAEMHIREEKRKHDDGCMFKEQRNRNAAEQTDDAKTISSTDQGSNSKKPKLFSLDSTGPGTNGASEQAGVKDSDIDAAKIAAMKAAELVNKNLVGTGYMSAGQKKKLLWGSKKTTTTEESAHRWDTSTFGDRERQEKFNKLMGVKGEAKVEHKADNPDMEKQREQLLLELEKQYTAGLRRRDGRTVGLGL